MRLALTASILIVLGSPYVGRIRDAVQASFPAHYRTLVASALAVGIAGALIIAIRALRRRPLTAAAGAGRHPAPSRVRYALLTGALSIAAAYAATARSGNVDVDLVEAFHFVEYGTLAFLYHRIWRGLPDASAIVLPVAAAVGVGIADEWLQWFVPGRVGELHDVGLNAVAVSSGVLIAMAIHAPPSFQLPRLARGRRRVAVALVALIVALAAFVDVVHMGHEVDDARGRTFRSQFDAEALAAASGDRAVRWRSSPPPRGAFDREDRYLSEGEWHVQFRNLAVSRGDLDAAWNENAILERFFMPVLDLGYRWAPEQRAAIERAAQTDSARPYVSTAEPYPLFVVDRRLLWAAAGTLAVAVAVFVRPRRGSERRAA